MIGNILENYFQEKYARRSGSSDMFITQASCECKLGDAKLVYGECMRSAYYSCLGMSGTSTSTLANYHAREMGNYIESMLLDALTKAGYLKDKQVKVEHKNPDFTGRMDAILEIGVKEVGLEIKSINCSDYILKMIFGKDGKTPFPKIEHVIQCALYLYIMADRMNEIILLYIRRDNGEIKEFSIKLVYEPGNILVSIDGKVFRRLSIPNMIARFKKLAKHIEEETTPPRDFMIFYTEDYLKVMHKNGFLTEAQFKSYSKNIGTYGDKKCSFCDYREICILEN